MKRDVEQLLNENVYKYEDALKQEEIEQNKKITKQKGLIIGILILLLSGIIGITSSIFPRKKKDIDKTIKNSIETVDDIEIDDISLADLGLEEEIVDTNDKIYGKTTGNVDKKEIVEKNGVIWKNKEAADKSNQVGKVQVDDKNGTLDVKPNGEVFEKEQGYEVKDQNGTVVDSGSNSTGTPDGFKKDENTGTLVKDEDYNKFTVVDADYYDKNGTLVYSKGEKVLKETLEKIKKDPNLTTVKPTTNSITNNTVTPPKVEETTTEIVQEEGTINKDGTYTIYGVTYMDKATFQAIMLSEQELETVYKDGVIYLKSYVDEMNNQKTLTK